LYKHKHVTMSIKKGLQSRDSRREYYKCHFQHVCSTLLLIPSHFLSSFLC